MLLQRVIVLFLIFVTVSCDGYLRQSVGYRNSRQNAKRGLRNDVFEVLFDVYDPSYLSGVWPKISNGVHLLVDLPCWDDMSVFLEDLAEGRAWAYDAVDASGRYQSAVFNGNRFWLGSKDECLQLDKNFKKFIDNETLALLRDKDLINSMLRRHKYFDAEANEWRWVVQQDDLLDSLVAADHRPPCSMAYTAVQLQLNVTKITMAKSYDIILGVCLPRSCTSEDVESIINFSIILSDNLKTNKTVPRIVKIKALRQIDGHYDIGSDIGAILLIIITILLMAVATVATLFECNLLKCVRYKSQSMSFDLPQYNNSVIKLEDDIKRKPNDIKSLEDILAEKENLNFVTISKVPRATPLPITLDVVSVDKTRTTGSCKRCGKYKRQCPNNRETDNVTPCPRVKYSSFASLSTEDRRKNNFFCRLLLCFSLRYSWKRIFNKNTANKDLALIHMMRIVTTLWIMFVHVALIVGYLSDNGGNINDRNSIYYIIATGTLAFDTLFFVSGLFSSHHFFYLKSRYSVEELVSFGGSCGQFMQFVCFVTNRIIRLLPSYAYSVLLSSVVARASRSTSALALPDRDHDNCANYWWRNLAYVTTAYSTDEECMRVSWYLSSETQLHAAGALVCALSVAANLRARLAFAVAAAFVLAAVAADVSAAYVDGVMQFANAFDAYTVIVERPWARVAPYFVGVFAGWLVHTMHDRLNLTKVTSSLLWGASIPLAVASASLPWLSVPWLGAWAHVSWPFALLWPTLAGCTCYAALFCCGAGRCGAALSRLSYSVLLLHGPTTRLVLLPLAPLCQQYICIWVYFVGSAAVTLGAALALALLIEMPCCSLFRRLSDCATS